MKLRKTINRTLKDFEKRFLEFWIKWKTLGKDIPRALDQVKNFTTLGNYKTSFKK